MFDKKIILLISFLLVTGSSYIIFHRKKDNNDEVNIVDNSDSSVNEEGSINENTESSSSFLKYFFLFIIIVIVIIIIAIAIVFFISYRKMKETPGDILFKKYKKFKEIEVNKTKIEKVKRDLNSGIIIKNIILTFEKTALKCLTNIKDFGNYSQNSFLIDFNHHFTNDETKEPYQENNEILYRFNIKEHGEIKKLFFDFFNAIVDCELYKDENFNSKSENEQEEIFYIFIAVIVEPFLENVKNRTFYENNNIFIFVGQNNNEPDSLKDFITSLTTEINNDTGKKATGFLNYIGNNGYFAFLFNRLIKEYFPINFVFEKKEVIKNK